MRAHMYVCKQKIKDIWK